jgi:hypothetical protein
MNIFKLVTIVSIGLLVGSFTSFSQDRQGGSGRGGISATNTPGDHAIPMYLTGHTNANGSITYFYEAVVASSTNDIHPVLSNLVVTVANNVTNVSSTYGVITAGILYAPGYAITTNGLIIGTYTNLGGFWMSNNISVLTSNRFQLGSSNAPWSNIWVNRIMGPNTQATFSNPPPASWSIQGSNGIPYAVLPDGTTYDLTATGAGSAVYINTAHTNITAKGLTIMYSLDYEVVTVSGTSPSLDATNSPYYYIELSGNTAPTFANFPVGRMFSLLVSNGASHTLTWPVNITWLNQNTPPSVTTNGYTHYQFFRPTTTITQAMVLGRELELAFAGGIVAFTNATTLTISNSTVGAADGTGIAWYTNTVLAGIKTNYNDIYGPNIFQLTTNEADRVTTYKYSFQSNFNTVNITNWLHVTGPQTNDTTLFTDSIINGSSITSSGQSDLQTVNMLSAAITNNITYNAPAFVLSGNSTQYAGNFDIGWNIIDLTNCLQVTGMVNVAAANKGKAWILTGRNLTSSNNVVSVSPSFQRAGTNFVTVPAAKRFRMTVFADGSGGVNETNMMADIQVYDSP